ncbi:MAG: ribonuclease D [Hymenobacteraceae bacterium]|nr:ribonuclease D [Hymenobacteraceae bacterium]MDX5395856.1 ribonuclease D [Hymenobacteraceae bacterium]MDX5444247.1 ribonuclease D [Hymenobacteraceae bacterium]MDX5511911.1 ribonuclease D [Hymenobacteraceae bacterium]
MEDVALTIDGNKIKLVSSANGVRQSVAVLRQAKELALDLEFDQNRHTYGFNLCLIQISDGETCYLFDPFTVEDLKPVWQLFEDPAITKIIHHANNDILLLNKLGCNIRNVIDTDVAAKILNYEKSSLATVLAEDFKIELDKSQQSSNWNTRPLTEEQLHYAALDVNYLHRVKDRLVTEIKQKGRLHWLEEEGRLLEQIEYTEPQDPHLRLKTARNLTYFQIFLLKELFSFREKLAQAANKPSAFIIPNDALVDLARNPDTDVYEFINSTRGIHRSLKTARNEERLRQVLQKARNRAEAHNIGHDFPPPYRRPVRNRETNMRDEALSKVQEEIVRVYGAYASRLIITSSVISEYAFTGKLNVQKQYALDIILETAKALNITL